MPFDGTDFPVGRGRPGRGAPGDNAVSLLIILIAFGLLVMPISLSAFVDIIHYIRK